MSFYVDLVYLKNIYKKEPLNIVKKLKNNTFYIFRHYLDISLQASLKHGVYCSAFRGPRTKRI